MIKKNIAKRQRTTPTGTDLGKETPTSPDWTRILCHADLKADLFIILPPKAVLNLRVCLKEWRDLPLHHMVGRCLNPPTSTILPDIAQLKDNFSLLQCFHKIYSKNYLTLNKQLALLNNNPAFITTKKKYMDYTQAYTILKQNTDSLSPEQEKKLTYLYNHPQQRLTMMAIDFVERKPIDLVEHKSIDLDDLNTHIQNYINTNLQKEKETLFERLEEEPESNEEAKAAHTRMIIPWISEHPILVFATDEEGWTPLHRAAEYGRTEIAQALLEAGAEVNAKTNKGCTPLHWAAEQERLETVQALLEAGADPTVTDSNGGTPLHFAAFNGRTAVARLLINKGANVNAPNEFGYTPLHFAACCKGYTEIVQALLKAGAVVNATTKIGSTPLHNAAEWGCLEIVKALIENGANMEAKDNYGRTPLDLAGNDEVDTLLRKAGATK